MVQIDRTLPYPYLPNYSGTYEDRRKIFRRRLVELLSYLRQLEEKISQNEDDISLLADLERCHVIAAEMLTFDTKGKRK